MGLISLFNKDSYIFIDTPILIYYIEQNQKYFDFIHNLFAKSKKNGINLLTSTVTIIEALTKPFKEKRADLSKKYKQILLNSNDFHIAPLDSSISIEAARLRGKYNSLKTPDAIQIASTVIYNCNYFISNDKKLRKVQEINYINLDN